MAENVSTRWGPKADFRRSNLPEQVEPSHRIHTMGEYPYDLEFVFEFSRGALEFTQAAGRMEYGPLLSTLAAENISCARETKLLTENNGACCETWLATGFFLEITKLLTVP